MKIVFAEEADSDLLQIHTYLAARNRPAAIALAKIFAAKLENIAGFPFVGRDRSSLSPGVRSSTIENYVIFYGVDDDRIVIVLILHGRRDIEKEFER